MNKFAMLTTAVCFATLSARAQTIDTVPPLSTLQSNLHIYIQKQQEAEETEFGEAHGFKWFYVAPSVTYNVMHNDVGLSFSVLPLIYYFKTKEKAKYKEFQISKKYQNKEQQDRLQLQSKYNSLSALFTQLQFVKEMFKNYNQFAQIKAEQYKNNEINTEESLKQNIALAEKKKAFYSIVDQINNTISEIQLLTNTEIAIYFDYTILE